MKTGDLNDTQQQLESHMIPIQLQNLVVFPHLSSNLTMTINAQARITIFVPSHIHNVSQRQYHSGHHIANQHCHR